ncbi:acyl carrier protein [Streptomyces sp. NPDC006645]|uniref:acyl carrier protein n=1 Tax=unclassified Streptomyces TaxID=2593676 RepID=UPI0033B74318
MDSALAPITDWLRDRNPEIEEIPLDLDLVESRLVDSLGFMEFILLLEDLVGHELALDTLDVDHFRTLRAIQDNFLSATPSPQRTS